MKYYEKLMKYKKSIGIFKYSNEIVLTDELFKENSIMFSNAKTH